MTSQELSRIVFYALGRDTTSSAKPNLWNRILALQNYSDRLSFDDDEVWPAVYEIGVSYFLLGEQLRANKYFSFLITHAPQTESAAWAETLSAIIGAVDPTFSIESQMPSLINSVELIREKHAHNSLYMAKSTLLLADMWQQSDREKAKKYYLTVCEQFAQFSEICAHSMFNLGLLYSREGNDRAARQTFFDILQNHHQEQKWALRAREELLDLFTRDAATDADRLARYKQLHAQFLQSDFFAIEALKRAADLLTANRDYDDAVVLYDDIMAKYAHMPEEFFAARMAKIEIEIETGEIAAAAGELEELVARHQQDNPGFAMQAKNRLARLLLNSANELAASKNYDLAAARYKRVIELEANNIRAHQGYIESLFSANQIDRAIEEYAQAIENNPIDNILLYALGLCYSYKGARVSEGVVNPQQIDAKLLKLSNETLQSALSFDYNLIDAYLTLSFNYEMLENYQRWQKTRPKSLLRKAGETASSPFVWLYHTVTFYNETRAPHYYESAISELTKALALNDEKRRPHLEALLARNMANNYYNLGEFGFRKAFEFYHHSLKYDSTFANAREEALVYERMGHCSLFVNDQVNGPGYLKRAINLFRQMNDANRVLINTKRLALLYEIGENSASALSYYQQAAKMEQNRGFYDGLMRSYRSIAYHNFVLQNPRTATAYANRALALMDSGMVTRSYGKPIYLQFGILGLYVPFPYDLRKLGAKSAFQLSTDEEEAFIYSIFSRNYLNEENYDQAIAFIKKKFAIYEQRHDYDALAIFQNNMGQIYYIKGDYDLAWLWFTNAYWMCRKTKYMGGQLLNITNAAYVVLTLANDPDPARRVHLLKYYNWITAKIRELLELTREDEAAFPFYHTQLNLLLGELLLIEPRPENETQSLIATATILTQAMEADSLLRRALDISQRFNFYLEEASIHFRLGRLSALLGEYEAALDEFQQSRDLAIQHRFPELHWQSITEIGAVIETLQKEANDPTRFRENPLALYQQAIRISETNRMTHPGITASRMRDLYSAPYKKAIARLLALNRPLQALQTAERLRERIFYECIERDKLQFFSDRTRLLFHRADSLQQTINRKELEMLQSGTAVSAGEKQKYDREILALQNAYTKAVNDIREEAPEIEPLIRITPVGISRLQEILPAGLKVIVHIAGTRQSHLAIISSDSVRFSVVPISREEMHSQLSGMVWALRQTSEVTLSPVLHTFFAALSSAAKDAEIIFIPETDFLLYPWMGASRLANDAPLIRSVSASLTNLYFSLRQTSAIGKRLFIAGDSAAAVFEPGGYETIRPVVQQSGDAFDAQRMLLAEADIIHLAVGPHWNDVWPSRSAFAFSIADSVSAAIRAIDLFKLKKSTAQLVNLDLGDFELVAKQPEPLILWERALSFTGIPSFMLTLWAANDSTMDYYNHFYQQLHQGNLPAAMQRTDSLLFSLGRMPADFVRFQLFGAAGLAVGAEDSSGLRVDHLIAEARTRFLEKDWPSVIELCNRSLDQARLAADIRDQMNDMLLRAALNNQQWDDAIKAQRQITAQMLRKDDFENAAEAYSLLALLYSFAGNESRAELTRSKNEQLFKRYGLKTDPIKAWIRAAAILSDGENYDRAQALYHQAAEAYQRQGRTADQCRSMMAGADIVLAAQNDPYAALQLCKKAAALELPPDQITLKIELRLLQSRIYESLETWNKAYAMARRADSLCTAAGDSSRLPQCVLQLAKVLFSRREFKLASDQLDRLNSFAGIRQIRVRALCLKSKIAIEQKNEPEAKQLAQRAFRLARETGDVRLINFTRSHYAVVLRLLDDPEEAAELLRQSLRVESLTSKERLQINYMLGYTLLRIGDTTAAQASLQTALQAAQHGNKARIIPSLNILLSRCFADKAQSETLLQNALAVAKGLHLHDLVWRAHYERARRAVRDNHIEMAHSEFMASLQALRQSRPRTRWSSAADGFDSGPMEFFNDYILFLINQKEYAAALNIAELARQTKYIYFISDRLLDSHENEINASATLDSLRAAYALAHARRIALWNSQAADRSSKELVDISNSLRAFSHKIHISAPFLFKRNFIEDVDSQNIISQLDDSVCVLIYYHAKDNLFSWRLTRDGLEFKQHPLDVHQLQQDVRLFLSDLQSHSPVNKLSKTLYKQLLYPWEDDLIRTNHLVIVPDPVIESVPFSALQSDSSGYVGLRWALSRVPRLDLLLARTTGRMRKSSAAVIVDADGRDEKMSFARLLGETLPRYYRVVETMPAEISLQEKLSRAASFSLIYLGGQWNCHSAYPLETVLRFPGDAAQVDGRSLLSMSWRSNIITIFELDALEPNINFSQKSLSDYLLLNGVGAMVIPILHVDDEQASAVLLKRFFRYTAAGNSPAQAMHRARLFVHEQLDARVSMWAGYSLVGGF